MAKFEQSVLKINQLFYQSLTKTVTQIRKGTNFILLLYLFTCRAVSMILHCSLYVLLVFYCTNNIVSITISETVTCREQSFIFSSNLIQNLKCTQGLVQLHYWIRFGLTNREHFDQEKRRHERKLSLPSCVLRECLRGKEKGTQKYPLIRQLNPFQHNSCAWIASGSIPRDAGSAGFSTELTSRMTIEFQISISETLSVTSVDQWLS